MQSYHLSRNKIITIIACTIFLLACNFLNASLFISTLLLATSMLVGGFYIMKPIEGVASLRNLNYIMFFGVGIYFRYLFVLLYSKEFCSFANVSLTIEPSKAALTSLVILFVVLLFALIFNSRIRQPKVIEESQEKSTVELTHTSLIAVNVVFVFLYAFVYGYSFIYLDTAVSFESVGKYDFAITLLRYVVCLIAYINLINYLGHKKFIYLIPYLIFIVSDISLSLAQAWKGKVLYEIIAFFIILYREKRKINIKWIILGAFLFGVTYPLVSMYRDILLNSASPYTLNAEGIIKYYKDNDMLTILSHRLSYYDEIYYVLQLSKDLIKNYIRDAGTILSGFFSGIIPRALWPDKVSVSQGLLITTELMFFPIWKGASTITFIGDAYLSYGYFGIFFVSTIYGYVIKNQNAFMNSTSVFHSAKSIVYCTILMTFMEGSIAGKLIVLILITVLFWFFEKAFIRVIEL